MQRQVAGTVGPDNLPLRGLPGNRMSIGHMFFEMIFMGVGGFITLVITTLTIPSDTQLRPIEPDWTGRAGPARGDLSRRVPAG